MRRFLSVASVLTLAAAVTPLASLGAQDRQPSCPTGSPQQIATADACEKATDLFAYMMPQLGTALVGGSHTLGIGSTLGGFPNFAFALRANFVRGDLPDVSSMSVSATGAVNSDIETTSQFIALPGVDFAVGIWKGFPMGVSRIGGIDLLGSLTYVPEIEDEDGGVSIKPTDGSTKIGLGARIGILEQSLVVPGVSFSYLVRDVPTLDLTASSGNDEFALEDFSVKTTSWRLSAQKNLMLIQLGAGVGQDTYKSSADITVTVNDPIIPVTGSASTSSSQDQSITRTTMYGSLGFNLFLAKVVAEIGRVSGGDVPTYNTFSEEADKARMYGSLGIRISF
jgi:hypothetical protein